MNPTILEALQQAKIALLDANRNGYTRGLEALALINEALSILGEHHE